MSERDQKHNKRAVALTYDAIKDRAPRITAKGQGKLAERIIALAEEHNIPIKKDTDLVQVLYRLDLETEVPPELYAVIAEIFAFVYSLNQKWSERESR